MKNSYDYEYVPHELPVVDDVRQPQHTGLLDHLGRPLYRIPHPIGFDTSPAKTPQPKKRREIHR